MGTRAQQPYRSLRLCDQLPYPRLEHTTCQDEGDQSEQWVEEQGDDGQDDMPRVRLDVHGNRFLISRCVEILHVLWHDLWSISWAINTSVANNGKIGQNRATTAQLYSTHGTQACALFFLLNVILSQVNACRSVHERVLNVRENTTIFL